MDTLEATIAALVSTVKALRMFPPFSEATGSGRPQGAISRKKNLKILLIFMRLNERAWP
ncbi:MAG: hypothetical protein ACJ8E1_13275 [Xanthobacteraceae bacterium]